jgi:hypothetical protein
MGKSVCPKGECSAWFGHLRRKMEYGEVAMEDE